MAARCTDTQAPVVHLQGGSGYEVRAAREFAVSSDRRVYRVGPGQRFGFGTSIGAREPIHLRFKDVESDSPCAPPEGLSPAKQAPFSYLAPIESLLEQLGHPAFGRLSQSSDGIVFDIDLSLPSDLKVWRSELYGTGVSDVIDRLESPCLFSTSIRGGHLG